MIVICAGSTVWYELLYGEWPFKGQPPEVIVWQVSRGIKPSLSNLQASKDVKVCITVSSFMPSDRIASPTAVH